jgi:hypothetical protein
MGAQSDSAIGTDHEECRKDSHPEQLGDRPASRFVYDISELATGRDKVGTRLRITRHYNQCTA